jgi:DNA-binding transcriptional LysR family regulator
MRNVHAAINPNFTIRGALLAQLPVFLAVAERRSFTAAAAELGVSPSAVSQAIARLERELKTPLLVRTTRSVNLTEAGARLAGEVRGSIGAVAASIHSVMTEPAEPNGVLRLNVPHLAARAVLPPVLRAYRERCPDVQVEVMVDDRNVDIVENGFDAGIRLREEVQKDMIAVRISPAFRFLVVGAPDYFAQHGEPRRPRDLVAHACLGWRYATTGALWRWEFEHRGRELEIAVDGPVTASDSSLLIACARTGLGLCYVPEQEVEEDLAADRLRATLLPFSLEVSGLFLYFPAATQRAPKLSAFVECAKAAVGAARRAGEAAKPSTRKR